MGKIIDAENRSKLYTREKGDTTMEIIVEKSLREWKVRLLKKDEEIETLLKDVELGSNKDVFLSTKLGKNKLMIEGIEKELDRCLSRQVVDTSGEM